MNYYLILIIICVILWMFYITKNDDSYQIGGSREAIFSRFSYQPDYPFISTFDTQNLDLLSKKYTSPSGYVFIGGRPYLSYDTPQSSWINPWIFPQQSHINCLQKSLDHCNEYVISIKNEMDKLGGLSVTSPEDIVKMSPCFNQTYNQCIKSISQ